MREHNIFQNHSGNICNNFICVYLFNILDGNNLTETGIGSLSKGNWK